MKNLREGFTTGSCAASAALACCLWMRDGKCPEQVCITVPEGRKYIPSIIPHDDGSCGVIKDSGDDPDITGGMEIIARVELAETNGEIRLREPSASPRNDTPHSYLPKEWRDNYIYHGIHQALLGAGLFVVFSPHQSRPDSAPCSNHLHIPVIFSTIDVLLQKQKAHRYPSLEKRQYSMILTLRH